MAEEPAKAAGSDDPAVFLRKASGVVRAMSPRDGMIYGYLSAAGLYAIVLFLFLGAGVFPRANVLLANILGILFFVPIYVVYSNLASAMPRSGGDYVFTSRLLTPSIGYCVAWAAWIFWGFFFTYLAASAVVTAVIAPMLSAIGVSSGNQWWIQAASTITERGWLLAIEIVLIVLAGVIMVRGMRGFVKFQRYFMFPGSIIGLILIAVLFLVVSKGTFFSHFDQFQQSAGGIPSGDVVSKANALGFAAGHSSLFDTLGFSVTIAQFYVWTIWSSELLGEIKSASKLRSAFKMFAGAGLLQFVTFMVGIVWAYSYFGSTFLRSFSWMVLNHPSELGGSWDFRGVTTFFYIPSLNIVVGIVLFLCFLGPVLQSLFNPQLSSSRMLLAMSFDRVLPDSLGKINARGVPHVAIWFGVIVSVLLAILATFVTDISKLYFWSSFATLFGIIASLIGGMIFPWRAKRVFDGSPGGRLRVLGIPVVTVGGVIGVLWIGLMMVISLTHSGIGLLEPGAARVGLVTFAAVALIAFLGFFGIERYRRRTGIEVAYAFKEIPPE
jgi:basic amino acid/polyamine antiporter, APA family